MSTNGTAYKDKVVLGRSGAFTGSNAAAYPTEQDIPTGLPPGSLSLTGEGNGFLTDALGAQRALLPSSKEAEATVIHGAGPQQLQSAVVAGKGQRFLAVDTSNGQVQAYLQPAAESDGDVIFVRHAGGNVPATIRSIDPEDGVNGGAGQTFILNPKTYIALGAQGSTKTWWLVGSGTNATTTSS